MGSGAKAALIVVAWPAVAVALTVVGLLAWAAWVTEDRCDCTNPETLHDGECLDCARRTPEGVQ